MVGCHCLISIVYVSSDEFVNTALELLRDKCRKSIRLRSRNMFPLLLYLSIATL
jgi:hypothetical protein